MRMNVGLKGQAGVARVPGSSGLADPLSPRPQRRQTTQPSAHARHQGSVDDGGVRRDSRSGVCAVRGVGPLVPRPFRYLFADAGPPGRLTVKGSTGLVVTTVSPTVTLMETPFVPSIAAVVFRLNWYCCEIGS